MTPQRLKQKLEEDGSMWLDGSPGEPIAMLAKIRILALEQVLLGVGAHMCASECMTHGIPEKDWKPMHTKWCTGITNVLTEEVL